jgi:hypothetical protein
VTTSTDSEDVLSPDDTGDLGEPATDDQPTTDDQPDEQQPDSDEKQDAATDHLM